MRTYSQGASRKETFVPKRRLAGLAATAALAVVAWEYLLNAWLHPEVEWSLAGLGIHALLDTAALAPLALLCLLGGLALAGRLGMPLGQWRGVAGAASLAALLLFTLAAPLSGPRDAAHEQIGLRYGIPLAEAQTAAVRSDLTISQKTQLCSFRSVRNPALAAQDEDALLPPGWLESVESSLTTAATQQAAFFPFLLAGLWLLFRRRLPHLSWRSVPYRHRLRLARSLKWAVAGLAMAVLFAALGGPGRPVEGVVYGQGAQPYNACTDGGFERVYDVSAIHISMPLNRFGDRDPDAFMYVLTSRVQEALNAQNDTVSNGLRQDVIQPLVLRANLGDCLVINFTNQLNDGPASLHILGLPHTIDNAGSAVGNNPDTFAAPNGGQRTYRIPVPQDPNAERSYYFHDHGASRQRVNHGLFGAVVAEPAGSVYRDVETGALSDGTGWEQIIIDSLGISFREFVIMYHEVGDETFTGILDGEGHELPQVDDLAEIYRPAARALNYRSEPFRHRLELEETGKALGYASYPFGDPATPIPRSYLGEATKTRLMHGGSEVFHVHHLHGGADRWRRNPNSDPANDFWKGLTKVPQQDVFSTHLDSQSIGPGTSYNLEHECGAGGCQQTAGDFLYHCHIGHHYIAGMWAFWRVFDTVVDGSDGRHPLAVRAELFQGEDDLGAPNDIPHFSDDPPDFAVSATALKGGTFDGITLNTNQEVLDFIADQLPPPGVTLDKFDATVWDWVYTIGGGPFQVYDPAVAVSNIGDLKVYGEPEDVAVWANFASATPGQRPEVLFNPNNARYTWPLLRPHLAQRPPFSARGHTGAPWLGADGDPNGRTDGLCPSESTDPSLVGRRKIFYPVSAITLPIQVTPTGVDPDGMIFALNEEKADIFAGNKPAQPLAIRSNVGDCVEIILTNEIPDGPLNHDFSKVNIHSHFVQFDPQASDGVITGFSYEQSLRPHANENRTLVQAAPAGATVIQVTNVNRLRPGVWIGIGLGEGVTPAPNPNAGLNDPQPQPVTDVRQIDAIDPVAKTITLRTPLTNPHAAGESAGVEFVRYNWYSDVDTGTVFFHTHVEFKDWDHGLFGAHIIQPKGSTYHDPVTGDVVRSGTVVDIHAPRTTDVIPGSGGQTGRPVAFGVDGPFREFMLFLHNNSPVEGPFEDGGGTINLRAEPFDDRGGDPAFLFSSVKHGDPITPLVKAYLRDPVIVRGMGLVERVGGVRFTGHRFTMERFADTADNRDGTFIGISERFDFSLEGGAGGTGCDPEDDECGYAGDYLYYSTLGKDFESGAWGILRVHDTLENDLQPLPGLIPPDQPGGFPQLTFTGNNPPSTNDPGNPCPVGANLRQFNAEILEANVVYNDDPNVVDSGGIVYRLGTGGGGSGGRPDVTQPLVIRANAGDCVEIDLSNDLGDRASISVGELRFDPQGSYGSAVGFNLNTTVRRNRSRLFRFYADKELGIAMLHNLADTETWPRGAYGALVVQPMGSQFFKPGTTNPIQSGIEADIQTPGGSYREFVALFSDEDRRLGQNTMPYPDEADGFTGISYSAEPLKERDFDDDPEDVFKSSIWGDPRLVVDVAAGTPFIFRVAAPFGHQTHVFATEGHRWFLEPGFMDSEQVFADVLISGMSVNAPLVGGAGGDIAAPGDYLFKDGRQPFLEAGLWAILRVTGGGAGASSQQITPRLAADEPSLAQSESVEINSVSYDSNRGTVTVSGDSGDRLTAAAAVEGIKVHSGTLAANSYCPGTLLGTASIAADGSWTFEASTSLLAIPPPLAVCVQFPDGSVAVAPVKQQ